MTAKVGYGLGVKKKDVCLCLCMHICMDNNISE